MLASLQLQLTATYQKTLQLPFSWPVLSSLLIPLVLKNSLQHTATQYAYAFILADALGLQQLQHTATHSNTLQLPCCKPVLSSSPMPFVLKSSLQHIATHYNTLQHNMPVHEFALTPSLFMSRKTLQRTAIHCNTTYLRESSPMPLVLNSCRTLRRTTTHCYTLQKKIPVH